jgi:DNA-binding Xre family transcriptional regulator
MTADIPLKICKALDCYFADMMKVDRGGKLMTEEKFDAKN